ncbi:SAF domain-containing protein [Microbacterium aureliae]
MNASARSARRPFWADVRFILGIVLIAVSVGGVWLVVAAARETDPVYAAARTIVVGEPVEPGDLRVVEVGLGPVADQYVFAEELADGAVASRTIGEGELVTRAALVDDEAVRTTTVVLRSSIDVPASVVAGTPVEVWSAPLVEAGEYATPRILVADATVVAVDRDDTMIGGGATALEVVIPRADVAAALQAMADGSALSVVPAAGGRG